MEVTSKKEVGNAAEAQALAYLQKHGLTLVERNYQVASGPVARGGEVDLIVRAPDGTLVFVEVRARRTLDHGGAAASISATKQKRIVYAARHYLRAFASPPACRFDVIAMDGTQLQWLQAAFNIEGL
jgi:putative endonuclease